MTRKKVLCNFGSVVTDGALLPIPHHTPWTDASFAMPVSSIINARFLCLLCALKFLAIDSTKTRHVSLGRADRVSAGCCRRARLLGV